MSLFQRDKDIQELLGGASPSPGKRVAVAAEVLPAATSAVAGGAYEGADRYSHELAMWRPSMGSADADILPQKELLDGRTRDMARNDAFVKSGINIHKDGIVGSQFRVNMKPEYEVLGLDEVWAEEFQEEVEAKFTLYAESGSRWLDAAGKLTLTAQVRLAIGIELLAGEVLAVADWIDDEPGRPFSTAMQFIDTDRLSNPPTVYPYGDRLRGGILHNERGRALGYYIRNRHPGDPWMYNDHLGPDQFKFISAKTPWGRQRVIHIYDQFRPEQSRGVSAMVAALKEMRMTQNFREVMLQNAVINATYAASIESELPSEAVFTAMGTGQGDLTGAINNYAGAYMSAIAGYANESKSAYLNGARIPHFYPGTKLQLRPAGQGGPLGTDFEASLLRYIAADLDLSYEQLSRDYSKTNYSSLKGTLNETEKGMQSRKKQTADAYADVTLALWLEEAIAKREITSMPRNAPNFWDGLNKEAYTACEWIGGSQGQIDELKETQAAVLRLKYNLSTDEAELARLGKDWRKVYRQRAREKKLRVELDIETAEEVAAGQDNMMNAASGAPRQKVAKGEPSDSSGKKSATGTLERDFMDAEDNEDIDARPNA